MTEEKEIRELLQTPANCGVSADHPHAKDPEHWCVGPVVKHRDSDLLTNVNYTKLVEALEDRKDLEGQWEIHRFSHWAVGWVDHLSFRVLDEDGKPSAAFHFVKKWNDDLENYPCADDDLLSEMEYDVAIEAIEREGSRWIKDDAKEGWASEVYGWLSDHDPGEVENRDGSGAYPSTSSVREALRSLGWHAEEDAEEA